MPFNNPFEDPNTSFEITALIGQWNIIYSNFPMWTNRKRKNPSLNYSLNSLDQEYIINDQVKYRKSGKLKTINGTNKVVSLQDKKFLWRGSGILRFLRSKWQIIHFNELWLIIYFEKTFFTPSGYDVAVKEGNNINPHVILEALNYYKIPVLKKIQ
ncbi:hypothetical protein [Portibacter marinus]|uniref:hypothetical protein n=1 Tax=Portibacter marinus TaxID=2898660 RepID=UPI001F35F369|nr:hypothetical protein [Portibacter marinus]